MASSAARAVLDASLPRVRLAVLSRRPTALTAPLPAYAPSVSVACGSISARFSIMSRYKTKRPLEQSVDTSAGKAQQRGAAEQIDAPGDLAAERRRVGSADGDSALVPSTPSSDASSSTSSSSTSSDDATDASLSGAGSEAARRVLSDLREAGAVHSATLAAVESTEEWKNYEAHVTFAMSSLRMRYAATPDEPMTPQRRSQMQAHLRQEQKAVLDEHADAAAKKFVDAASPEEIRALRHMLTRLDAKAVGGGALGGEGGAIDLGDVKTADGQSLKEALWDLSQTLGKADPRLARGLLELGARRPPTAAGGAGAGAGAVAGAGSGGDRRGELEGGGGGESEGGERVPRRGRGAGAAAAAAAAAAEGGRGAGGGSGGSGSGGRGRS